MNFESFVNRSIDYFEEHEERVFLLKAALLIGLIFMVRGVLYAFLPLFFLLFLFSPVICWLLLKAFSDGTSEGAFAMMLRNLTLLPVPVTEKEWTKEGFAWVTYALICVNVFFYYFVQSGNEEFVRQNLVFLPFDPEFWNVPLSLFSSMFLHGSSGHLWGNMLFLWAFGTVLEKRIGWRLFAGSYLFTGMLANLVGAIVSLLFVGGSFHCLGASGAISGVMGIYAVRCYFKTLLMPLPLLGILSLIFPIYLKVRVNALVLIGLFFLLDVGSGIDQLTGTSHSNVAHWVHVGGMLAGILLGKKLKLGRPAIAERHAELSKQNHPEGGFGISDKRKSLQKVLEIEPDNLDATLGLARIGVNSEGIDDGGLLYQQAIKGFLKTDRSKAAEIFREYINKGGTPLEPELHYRLCGALVQAGDLPSAARFLEMLVNDETLPTELREKSMFQVGRLIHEMDMPDASIDYFRRFLEKFPHSTLAAKVENRLNIQKV